ncbi:GNAT family N-acetyltransferase [Actinomadura madurae]|uniref:GNAT family N-acetyltransferase n=1 Tax=Actinomadura madurae TaxID=1993 RepID=UPI0020D235DD|nr:GNAT family N-acetyltransferase [Actinomadura madurae]MCQ0011676.1 GNAT family N-acetyltransferase [Actinomadura madurae]
MLRPAYPIETERLILRPFREDDLEGLYAYQSLPEVARYLYWKPRSLEESRSFLKQKMSAATVEKEGDWLVLAVEWRETGELIGEVNLQWRSREHRQGEIGYIFNPAYHGKGFATEAAEAVLRLGFEGLDLHRVCGGWTAATPRPPASWSGSACAARRTWCRTRSSRASGATRSSTRCSATSGTPAPPPDPRRGSPHGLLLE